MDTYEGYGDDPLSLHKYIYCEANPVNETDDSGNDPLSDLVNGRLVHRIIAVDFTRDNPGRFSGRWVSTILASTLPPGMYIPMIQMLPDLVDATTKEVYEIKPLFSLPLGIAQLSGYIAVLNHFTPGGGWHPGSTYVPPDMLYLGYGAWAKVYSPIRGVILYDVIDLPSLGLFAVGVVATADKADLAITVAVETINSLMGAP
jgi:hypothetical protein